MAEALNHLKKDYRARFCHGGGSKIDVQPGQNVLKLIQDCFESCSSDLTINSPNATLCSAPVVKNEKTTSMQSLRPKARSPNSVKRACNSPGCSPITLLKPVSSRGQSCESPLKPAIHDYVAVSKKPESPVSKSKKNTLQDVEVLCRSPAMFLDPEDDHGSVGSPFPVEKGKSSPVLEYSASISPPSPPPVKDQDIEIENECEFLIDESGGASFASWISIPSKNRKSKKDGSATPVSKSQPSEQKRTQSKKGKNRKAQVEALTKQKLNNLDVGAFDFKRMSKSDPISNSEGNVLRSQSQKSTHTGKTKKDALRQDSPNQKKNTSWKPEAEELILSWSGLETEASDAEKCKTRVLPSEDLPMPSSGHQQEQTVSPKKSLKSSKNLQSASKASQHLHKRKQTAKQKLPKVKIAKKVALSPRKDLKKSVQKSSNKKPQLQREKSSDSELSEEEHEREPVDLKDVCTTPLRQKLETPVIQKLAVSEKPRNVLHTLDSPGGANNQTPVKALQHLMDSVKNSEKKQLPAKYSGKIPRKIPCRTNKAVYSNPEDTESQTDSDSSSVQNMARKKQKLSDEKIKNNKRKRNRQHGPQNSFVAEKAVNYERWITAELHWHSKSSEAQPQMEEEGSGPVLEHCDKFASNTKSSEQYDTSSENFDDLNYKVRDPLSDNIPRHKIVMPSNTPNVRRTKRIRLRPLEYWRGERINYTVNSSGGLVISGLEHPKPQSRSKNKQRKDRHKRKANKTNRREIPASLDHNLADTSKPTIVLDPETNEEVVLECVNTESSHACSFKDEAVEIYKNLNTSVFATGRLILKPLKEKGHQFVHMDTIAFHIIHGKIIVTLHKTSYYLTTGDSFYVPPGNGYNIRNLLNEESILLFTQLKVR
ncbi:centromere protein C isoform X4 [Neopelma chrysocephalum]|uniref:centromere protein C isoform X4 n=1 Tax=Neopelma chrysocephalum TaxID=114329 RepID=UPI000FCD012E|nr:centromere protein C isoform X4 [Neopelma chrysocephalum]